MKRILAAAFAVLLLIGTCQAAESVTLGTLLTDLVEAYESPSEDDMARIDADVSALDDEIAEAIAEHWKRVYLDENYTLLLFGKDDPAELDIPDPSAHAFVILGYELQNGEMTEELKGRCSAAAAAAQAFPEAILVCSGGATGKNNPEHHTEAGLMRDYLVNVCGIDASRIFIDERARNTAENAIYTFEILRRQEIETMTIVTSAYHQRRAQVLYNALAAQYRQEAGYCATIVGNFCYDIEPSGIHASMDDRLAVQQLAGILGWTGDIGTEEPDEKESKEEKAMHMKIGDTEVPVTWEENASVAALQEHLPRTIPLSMYGGFEQVGSLGESLPRSDEQTATDYGDIVLYSGDQIVVFYGTNRWAYTRLGHVDLSRAEMEALLSRGDVTITLWEE